MERADAVDFDTRRPAMIIWGTRGSNRVAGNGQFFCPRCDAEQQYKHIEVKQYFTLYFIPLIPMGKQGEFIECSTCAGTFAPEILTYDPEVEKAKTTATFRRLCVLFLLDQDRCTAPLLAAVQEIVGDTMGVDIEREDIATDVAQAQGANPDVKKFFKSQTTEFSDDGKLILFANLKQILETEGPLLPGERDRIVELGKASGLRKKHVTAMLDSNPEE